MTTPDNQSNDLQDQVSKMSEQELNLAIAKVKFPDALEVIPHPNRKSAGVKFTRSISGRPNESYVECYDWVSDDALAFRLMVEILKSGHVVVTDETIVFNSSEYEHDLREFTNADEFRLRLCECFLLMQAES